MFILFPKENVAKVIIILFPTKFPMENYSLYFDFLLDCKMMYRGWRLPGAGRLRGVLRRKSKVWIEAPVNGGRNYNGPKVAKFLVGA